MFELLMLGSINSINGIGYLFIGILVGLIFGVIPGLAGSAAMALLIPFTYSLPPEVGVLILVGALGSATIGGGITSVLINVPGTPNNLSTCFDGYPLAKKGRAGYAISLASWSSFWGSILGTAVLLILFPFLRTILLAFGPPEWFFLAVFGLTAIASVSEGSIYKGLITGLLGIMLGFHGLNPVTGGSRYIFGINYLLDGLPLVPVLMGMFAISEMIKIGKTGGCIAEAGIVVRGGGMEGFVDVIKHWWLVIRSAAIGVIIGAIPGIGGSVSNFLAYVHARQTSKHPETFGQGNPEGVIASEVANNSKDGGALIPTLALGIPGSPTTAVLMAGILIHGITPGRELMTEGLPVVFTIIVGYCIAVLFSALIAIVAAPMLAKITAAPGSVVVVCVVILCTAGAYAMNSRFGDIIVVFIFGLLGYVMSLLDFPRVPLIIGLLLGPLAEQSFHLSLQISGNSFKIFFTRPISFLLLLLTILMLAKPLIAKLFKKKDELQEV